MFTRMPIAAFCSSCTRSKTRFTLPSSPWSQTIGAVTALKQPLALSAAQVLPSHRPWEPDALIPRGAPSDAGRSRAPIRRSRPHCSAIRRCNLGTYELPVAFSCVKSFSALDRQKVAVGSALRSRTRLRRWRACAKEHALVGYQSSRFFPDVGGTRRIEFAAPWLTLNGLRGPCHREAQRTPFAAWAFPRPLRRS